MSSKSIYCKCKNRYLVEWLCNCKKQPYYWKQGIGITEAIEVIEEDVCVSVFDNSFDYTFGCVEENNGVFDETFNITFN